jgi:hypothetical protein
MLTKDDLLDFGSDLLSDTNEYAIASISEMSPSLIVHPDASHVDVVRELDAFVEVVSRSIR